MGWIIDGSRLELECVENGLENRNGRLRMVGGGGECTGNRNDVSTMTDILQSALQGDTICTYTEDMSHPFKTSGLWLKKEGRSARWATTEVSASNFAA